MCFLFAQASIAIKGRKCKSFKSYLDLTLSSAVIETILKDENKLGKKCFLIIK